MKKTSMKLAVMAMFACGSTATIAQTNSINVVTTAVPFLRITPDARSAGMGEVGIAISPDANSGFWNIAKTTFATNKMQIGATYTPWLSDLKLNDVYLINAAGYYKLDELQAVSGGLRYFSLGNIQFTDASGNNLNSFRPREFSLEGGYSRKLSNNMGLGVALRYISSDLASGAVGGVSYKKGTSIAGDIHYFYQGTNANGNGFDFGATLSNLGSKISYTNDAKQKDYIPANLGLGAVYNKVLDAENKITFGLDLNKLLVPTPPVKADGETDLAFSDRMNAYRTKGVVSSWFSSIGDGDDIKEVSLSAGAEYWFKDQFAFRLGYFGENKLKGDRRYITMGAGVKYNEIGFNFAYLLPTGSGVTRNPLSNTLRFSLMYDMK